MSGEQFVIVRSLQCLQRTVLYTFHFTLTMVATNAIKAMKKAMKAKAGAQDRAGGIDSNSDLESLDGRDAESVNSEATVSGVFAYVISGLQLRSELNGLRCIAEKVDRTAHRVHVRLPGTCRCLILKCTNLTPERVSPAPETL